MHCVILAGGKGTRLKPYTTLIPKPLVPIGDKAVLELILERLKRNGVSKVILTLNHLSKLIEAYFGNGEKYGLEIEYITEEMELGTFSPILNINSLPENFIVMNGDVLMDIDMNKIFQYHIQQDSVLTIASVKRSVSIDYGVLEYADGALEKMLEKPKYHYSVSTGFYVMNKKILNFGKINQFMGMDALINILLSSGIKINIYEHPGRWLDIGRPDDYEQAQYWTVEGDVNSKALK